MEIKVICFVICVLSVSVCFLCFVLVQTDLLVLVGIIYWC